MQNQVFFNMVLISNSLVGPFSLYFPYFFLVIFSVCFPYFFFFLNQRMDEVGRVVWPSLPAQARSIQTALHRSILTLICTLSFFFLVLTEELKNIRFSMVTMYDNENNLQNFPIPISEIHLWQWDIFLWYYCCHFCY